VAELTGGQGVDVVYDSVGKDTFEVSLDCLKPRGLMVLYGGSSGPVPPIDLQVLNRKGSLYVTRPKLGDYVATPTSSSGAPARCSTWSPAGSSRSRSTSATRWRTPRRPTATWPPGRRRASCCSCREADPGGDVTEPLGDRFDPDPDDEPTPGSGSPRCWSAGSTCRWRCWRSSGRCSSPTS
jgi:hypothetical protein